MARSTIGRWLPHCSNMQTLLTHHLSEENFDYVCVPLVHPRYYRDPESAVPNFSRSALQLESADWGTSVVATVSRWIDADCVGNTARRRLCERALSQELNWAAHLSVPACIIDLPPTMALANTAKCIHAALQGLSNMQVWVRVPLCDALVSDDEFETEEMRQKHAKLVATPWKRWNLLRTLCHHHILLSPILELTPNVPPQDGWLSPGAGAAEIAAATAAIQGTTTSTTNSSNTSTTNKPKGGKAKAKGKGKKSKGASPSEASENWSCSMDAAAIRMRDEDDEDDEPEIKALKKSDDVEELYDSSALRQWLGEPLKAVVVPSGLFLTNKAGYPVLSRAHQRWIKRLFKLRVQFIIRGHLSHENGAAAYLEYLHHVATKDIDANQSDKESFESPYYDFLQAPLQPLQDHLESQTYETFERDPIKYKQYEKAILLALQERHTEDDHVVIMVVGAGRGPLVRRAMRAAKLANRRVRVYALDKNPQAVVTLSCMVESMQWEGQVVVVHHDMRDWEAPEKADIVVSELLGSFGDNEASPECLDGAMRLLKEDGKGISIPCSYTSFLAPVQSSKLFNEVKATPLTTDSDMTELKNFETPYVVKVHNAMTVSEEIQPCFTFEHVWEKDMHKRRPDNQRYTALSFRLRRSCVVHGFVGYFDAKLYGNVHISINPPTHSPGMFSWFPLFFPLRTPVHVTVREEDDHVELQAQFWRCCTSRKLWYEWAVSQPEPTVIHNPSGRSYYIGL